MDALIEIVGSLVKELSKNLSALDLILVIIILIETWGAYTAITKMWEAFSVKLDALQAASDARFEKMEKANKENTHRITESIDSQGQIFNNATETFNRIGLEVTRAVTILQERHNK